MKFLLEIDNPEMKIEEFLWRDLLDDKTCPHDYSTCSLPHLADYIQQNQCSDIIPLGSIIFTNTFFQLVHNIKQMNPIEIPPCLRTSQYLGREYKIVPIDNIPRTGSYFIKDATEFKNMHHCGPMEHFDRNLLNPEHLYVVSEALNIIAEYRIYFLRGEVYAVEYYNGNPLYFPDRSTIIRANAEYSKQIDYPKSYTMDVMVTKDGTFLTEIHPVLFSCGLYTTVLSTNFLNGYFDGLQYILQHNTLVTPT